MSLPLESVTRGSPPSPSDVTVLFYIEFVDSITGQQWDGGGVTYLRQLKTAKWSFVVEQMTQCRMCSNVRRHRRKAAHETENTNGNILHDRIARFLEGTARGFGVHTTELVWSWKSSIRELQRWSSIWIMRTKYSWNTLVGCRLVL